MTFASDQQRKWYFANHGSGVVPVDCAAIRAANPEHFAALQLEADRLELGELAADARASDSRAKAAGVDPSDKSGWDAWRWAVHQESEQLRSRLG